MVIAERLIHTTYSFLSKADQENLLIGFLDIYRLHADDLRLLLCIRSATFVASIYSQLTF